MKPGQCGCEACGQCGCAAWAVWLRSLDSMAISLDSMAMKPGEYGYEAWTVWL